MDRRAVFGWCMYDWANSAYILTVITAVLPVYFSSVVVPENGLQLGGSSYSATSLWGLAISASALLVFIFAPVLGAIADTTSSRKRFLMVFCYMGSLAAVLMAFCSTGDVWLTMGLLIVSQIGFVGGNIFYDSFLPLIAPPEKIDWVSGKGFAYGYIGSDIQFLLSLLFMIHHDGFGVGQAEAVQIVLAFSGLWWGGFSIVTWRLLNEERPEGTAPSILHSIRTGLARTWETTKKVRQLKHLTLFLVAFMLYNEGIQTVIVMATIYGKEELALSTDVLMLTLLIIQLVAMGGSLVFGKMAERLGTKKVILMALTLWCAVVVYAYFMTTSAEYLVLGVVVGLVLGGSQSLSRSYYGSMIPTNASAEFYGFYSVFTKFSAIWGPLLFALLRHWTGTARTAIVSLVVFFVTGMALLIAVDDAKARSARAIRFEGIKS